MNAYLTNIRNKWISAAILSFLIVMVIEWGATGRVLADGNPPIEGYHDGEQGDVPGWACNVGGWAMDPQHSDQDIDVRILVDGVEVAQIKAENYREDLEIAWNEGTGGCPGGTCAFNLSLWDLLTHYEAHEIKVEAQDIHPGDWYLLNSSPKTITCRSYDIYAFNPVNGVTEWITTDLPDADEYDPTWSQNGKMVAYDVVQGDSHGIYITNLRTGESAPLVGAQDGGNDASWSPNGRWIAFDRRWYGNPNIYIVPATGGTEILVRENAVSGNWAPNGKRMVFQDDTDGSIRTIPVDGGQGRETLVVDYGELPAWSPDGNWIAFTRDDDIWKVPVNTHGVAQGEPIQLTGGPFQDGKPTWSTDSQTIIYDSGFGQDWDLWQIPAAGGMPTWLTGAPAFGEYGAANARNSAKVAYASFSPEGQAARTWAAAFTYELPAGAWDTEEPTHSYQFWEGGTPGENVFSFEVSRENPLYDGMVLIRPWMLRAREGDSCFDINAINPDQHTQFHVGWTAEGTYAEALAYYDVLNAQVSWDDGVPVALEQHEIVPFTAPFDWYGYTCTFTAGPPAMKLRVNYGHDWVESFYEAGHEVVVSVTDGDGNIKATATEWTEPKDFWDWQEGFQTGWSEWVDGDGNPMESPPDIQPYDWVTAAVDNGVTAQVQIGEISGMIDLDADSVEGTILAPWFSSENDVEVECHSWGAPLPEEIIKYDMVLPDGTDTYACAWDPEYEWDIQPGQDVGVGYFGPDWHWVANVIPNPQVWAFPDANQIFGYGWPMGSDVDLTVNGAYLMTATVEGAPWDENDIMAFFDLGELHDLGTGDVILLSGSGMAREHTVQYLTVTDVDWEADTVTGEAENGVEVHAWVHGFGQDVWLSVTDNTWTAYFGSEAFHLQPGMCGRAEIRVEGYNSTNVDWCIPLPSFAAYMAETIEGYDWPMGDEISLTINGDEYPEHIFSEQRPGFPEGETRVLFELWQYDISLEVNDYIVMTDVNNDFYKALWVADLLVTDINPDGQTVSGIYDPDRSFWTQLDGQDPLEIIFDGNTWVATFAEMPPGAWGYVAQDDEDHDGTVWDFQIP